jgi:UDP-glucose 4-epimerase
MTKPAVAVIGSHGFLGRATVRALRAAGVPVQEYTRDRSFLDRDGRIASDIEGVRTVVWLVSSINPRVAEESPDLIGRDRAAMESLIDGLRRLDAPPRIVNLGSGGTVYDTAAAPPPYDESAPTGPTGAYGKAKLMFEGLLVDSGLPSTSLRLSNAYGPGQATRPGQGVVAHWLEAAVAGRPLHIFGDGEAVRDFVFVDDVAAAIVAACASERVPPVVNVGSGQPTRLRDLAEIVLAAVADPALEITLDPGRTFDVATTWLDVSLARTALGWSPTTTLPDGVASQLAELRAGGARS